VTRWELLAGVGLDLALGDPRWMPHPVRGIGWLISRSEHIWRRTGLPLRLAGVLLCGSVVFITTSLVWLSLPWANVYWVYSFLALRSLDAESNVVVRSLQSGDIKQARSQLAMIVGRDTEHLDQPEILRAVIETVSENMSDGVVAPLLYLVLLGPAGMAAYKAVNTLDSMIGYKDERYRELGWASARLDDVLNFIPARITAVLVWIAAGLTGMNISRSIRITFRDANLQPSPNSGWPEAAFAGALGVRLGGANVYRGVTSHKAHLGDPMYPISVESYKRSRTLLYASSALLVIVLALCI
jgi:adenosylcobinamide-phosphate synthase